MLANPMSLFGIAIISNPNNQKAWWQEFNSRLLSTYTTGDEKADDRDDE